MRKSLCLMFACALVLGGCASFKNDPVKMTAITAVALPVGIALAVPLEVLKIADEQSRLGRIGKPVAVDRPPNEQPLYGGIAKTPGMIEADRQFIAATEKFGYTRAQGSDRSVQLGWQYFFAKKDIATAMKRFNQAWLLDPGNGDAFHGFAVLVMARDHDAARADALFRQGLAAQRQSPGIYLDYGRFLVMAGRPAEAIAPLRQALGFSDMGPDAEALLTLALYRSGDVAAACAESAKIRDEAQRPLRDSARAICKH